MIVTVKDRRGRLVRNATVRVRPTNFQARKRFVVGKQRTKRSSKIGQANFLVLVRRHALGKRLFMLTVAQTPRAKGQTTTSVRLPKGEEGGARRRPPLDTSSPPPAAEPPVREADRWKGSGKTRRFPQLPPPRTREADQWRVWGNREVSPATPLRGMVSA